MTHRLPDLPYEKSALEPNIDTRTMAIHHDKHHQAYVNNLNQALEGYPESPGHEYCPVAVGPGLCARGDPHRSAQQRGWPLCHSMFWRA